eukprot:gene2137-2174_t
MLPITSGTIVYDGTDITRLSRSAFQPYRRRMQMIFQDPYASLDPRKSVGSIIGEALDIHGLGRRADRPGRVDLLLEQAGLYARPRHPYTQALLSAIPSIDPTARRGYPQPAQPAVRLRVSNALPLCDRGLRG